MGQMLSILGLPKRQTIVIQRMNVLLVKFVGIILNLSGQQLLRYDAFFMNNFECILYFNRLL